MNIIKEKFALFIFFTLINHTLGQDLINDIFKLPRNENIIRNDTSSFAISFNTHNIINNGHSNIDNNGELFVSGTFAQFFSSRVQFSNRWLAINIEPYIINQNNLFKNSKEFNSLFLTNNHSSSYTLKKSRLGLRKSSIKIYYKKFGIEYGNINHWWGPGNHSSIVLSTNSPSQLTYKIGTIEKIKIDKFSFFLESILMPYETALNTKIFFTGLRGSISHNSSALITTVGFHRIHLSGELPGNLLNKYKWSASDAISLIFEPLFGQGKRNKGYTLDGTPGFDYWDQIISGYAKMYFVNQDLEIYIDIASDDSRANFSDLIAHWDHTLGYQIGLNKIDYYKKYSIFYSIDYLSTRISNTYNPLFFRGDPNSLNYYNNYFYDYYTYQGRRMGAHSGSSSDDFYFLLGLNNNYSSIYYFSLNRERHGLKYTNYPEVKNEIQFTYIKKNKNRHHSLSLSFEYEVIKNFGYIKNKSSHSRFIWLGYSFSI
tara:strand:- start:159 stop:1613 length:1455 start_codon:yes stop_codon:yes gene_type:complete